MAVIKDDIIFCKEKQINELNIVILSVPPFYCILYGRGKLYKGGVVTL